MITIVYLRIKIGHLLPTYCLVLMLNQLLLSDQIVFSCPISSNSPDPFTTSPVPSSQLSWPIYNFSCPIKLSSPVPSDQTLLTHIQPLLSHLVIFSCPILSNSPDQYTILPFPSNDCILSHWVKLSWPMFNFSCLQYHLLLSQNIVFSLSINDLFLLNLTSCFIPIIQLVMPV